LLYLYDLALIDSIIIDASTEAVISSMIEAMKRFIREGEGEDQREGKQEGIPLSSVAKRHFQLQIETLQNAPRDVEKLRQIIKAKERENNEARHIDDTERLVTEIEMLKLVLCLVSRSSSS
jgi:hypothetical protein